MGNSHLRHLAPTEIKLLSFHKTTLALWYLEFQAVLAMHPAKRFLCGVAVPKKMDNYSITSFERY